MAVAPFAAIDVHFDQNGACITPLSAANIASLNSVTDLIAISHGWNNDDVAARALYDAFFGAVDTLRSAGTISVPASRAFAVLRIFWPSKQFDLPSGAAGGAAEAGNPSLAAAEAQLGRLIAANTDPAAVAALTKAQNLVPTVDTLPSAADDFVRLVLSTAGTDNEENDSISTAFAQSSSMTGSEMLDALGRSPTSPPPIDSPAASESLDSPAAAGVQDVFGGVLNFLNLFTYKTMKERAGIVGVNGVAPVLAKLRATYPKLRVHLIGHSFGGRLITSVANAFPGGDWGHQVSSMTLLQAAFSQFGIAKNYLNTGRDGAFRNIISRGALAGEIAITHTTNDQAVGLAYPLASRLFNQVASAVGDANDLYGGIGTNGAQDTPEAVADVLVAEGSSYAPLLGGRKIRNLLADQYIKSHGDVTGLPVAYVAMRNAILSPAP